MDWLIRALVHGVVRGLLGGVLVLAGAAGLAGLIAWWHPPSPACDVRLPSLPMWPSVLAGLPAGLCAGSLALLHGLSGRDSRGERHLRVPLLLALALGCIHPGWAARSVSSAHPVAVTLAARQPTAVALPEPVASVSVGVAPERFSLDYDGPYLFLLPLDPAITGRLFVVGQSGTLYVITFKVGTPADDVVHVTAPPAGAASGTPPPPVSVATLLRAMRTGTTLSGQQAVNLPPPVLPDPRVRVTGASALALGPTLGLVLTLRNTQQTPLTLDLRLGAPPESLHEGVIPLSTWTWPPRLTIRAIAAQDEIVAPAGETRVFLVLERRP